MNSILLACSSQESAERGLRVAADLSVACGSRLCLAYAPKRAAAMSAAAGMDALGNLSNVLFTGQRSRTGAPMFDAREPAGWLQSLEGRVSECWEADDPDELRFEVWARQPDLVIACDGELSQMLVTHTSAPVWHVRRKERVRAWFTARQIRCAIRGPRAMNWAQTLAADLGAELAVIGTGIFGSDQADLVVVERAARLPLRSAFAAPPLVVV